MIRFWLLLLMLTSAAAPLSAQTQPRAKRIEQKAPAKTVTPAEPEQKPADPTPPYEQLLLKLAETMGSLSFLSGLCEGSDSSTGASVWRAKAQQLLESEGTNPTRKQLFIGSFNRGFNGYGEVYRSCTPNALLAKERLIEEGAKQTREIASKFGN